MRVKGNRFQPQIPPNVDIATPANTPTTIVHDATSSQSDEAEKSPTLPENRQPTRFEIEAAETSLSNLGVNNTVIENNGTSVVKPAQNNGIALPLNNGVKPTSIEGAIDYTPQYQSILNKLRAGYKKNTTEIVKVELTPKEIDCCKVLFAEYVRDMHIVAFTIDELILGFYKNLINYKTFPRIGKIDYFSDKVMEKPPFTLKNLTHREYATLTEPVDFDEIVYKKMVEDLGNAMAMTSKALNKFIFSKDGLDRLCIIANLNTMIPRNSRDPQSKQLKLDFEELGMKDFVDLILLLTVVDENVLGAFDLYKWDFITLHFRGELENYLNRPKGMSMETFFNKKNIASRRGLPADKPEDIRLQIRDLGEFHRKTFAGKSSGDIFIGADEYEIMAPAFGRLQKLALVIETEGCGFYYSYPLYEKEYRPYTVKPQVGTSFRK